MALVTICRVYITHRGMDDQNESKVLGNNRIVPGKIDSS